MVTPCQALTDRRPISVLGCPALHLHMVAHPSTWWLMACHTQDAQPSTSSCLVAHGSTSSRLVAQDAQLSTSTGLGRSMLYLLLMQSSVVQTAAMVGLSATLYERQDRAREA